MAHLLRLQSWLGLLDLLALAMGLVSVCIPTRVPAFFRSYSVLLTDYTNDEYGEWRLLLMCNLLFALLDLALFMRYFQLTKTDYPTRAIRFKSIGHVYKGLLDVVLSFERTPVARQESLSYQCWWGR